MLVKGQGFKHTYCKYVSDKYSQISTTQKCISKLEFKDILWLLKRKSM